jgi:hypothetical protein
MIMFAFHVSRKRVTSWAVQAVQIEIAKLGLTSRATEGNVRSTASDGTESPLAVSLQWS